MKFKHYIMALLVVLTACCVTSCKEEDKDNRAKAVLVSAKSITFEGQNSDPQLITVYADAQWTVEAPEWVNVSPSTGYGTTEVTISVADNMRDGALDNPRKTILVFKGATLASRSEVMLFQSGDNYRGCQAYNIEDVYKQADDCYLEMTDVLVTALTAKGFMVSNGAGTAHMYVIGSGAALGDKVDILGQKLTDSQKLAYVTAEKVTVKSSGNAVSLPAATDITGSIDTYTAETRALISVEGILNGTNVVVDGQKFAVSLIDVPASADLAAKNGHTVKVTGYFAGIAAPFINMTVQKLEDKGAAQTIYFTEDFEWLDPWAEAGACGDHIATDDPSATSPQIKTPTVDGVTALAALEAKGYAFHRVTTKTEGECIYLLRNYLKFGKTSYQAGLTFPAIDFPADAKGVCMSFDWCPQRQGSGKIDPVNLIIVVTNGDTETIFEVPTHDWADNHKLEWINANVELTGVTLTKDTKITLRQTQWPAATANRWLLDNIKFYSNK